MRSQRGSTAFSGKTLLAFAIIIGGAAYVYLPMYWDYWAMKTIVRDAAQEWRRSLNVDHARGMMLRDMKRKEISTDVKDRSCVFFDSKKTLRVECEWTGSRLIPLIDKIVTQEFSFTLSTETEGKIEFY